MGSLAIDQEVGKCKTCISRIERLRLSRIVAFTVWLKTELNAGFVRHCTREISYGIVAQQSSCR